MPSLGWRYLLGVAAIPLLIFFAACFVRVLLDVQTAVAASTVSINKKLLLLHSLVGSVA